MPGLFFCLLPPDAGRVTAWLAPTPPPAILGPTPRRHARMHHHDLLYRRAQQWLPAFLAMGMSAFVAAVVTAINTGIDWGFPGRWLLAWSIACPAAILAAYLFRPLAWRVACLAARLTTRVAR